jgi:hypothetical protein
MMALWAENSRAIARFGAMPNRLAMVWIGRLVSSATIDRLIARGIYSRSQVIARELFKPALEKFLISPRRTFPIVGPAGRGKSSLLALLAESYDDAPLFFLRSADVSSDESPVEVLDRMIAAAVADAKMRFSSFARIRPLDDDGPVPLLLWDAVNELPFEDLFITEEWLPELIGAAGKAGMKLIFTCRPELFDAIEQASYVRELFPGPPQKETEQSPATEGWFMLGGFTDGELRQARQAYRVPPTLPDVITRHPLLLRLAAEAVEKSPSFVTRSSVLKSSLDRSVARIVKLAKLPHRLLVDRMIQELARAVARSSSGVAPGEIASTPDQMEILRQLVMENVIEAVADGFRFVFDEVYEIALAATIDVAAIMANGDRDPSSDVLIGFPVLSLALEILIDKGDIETVGIVCARLVERLRSKDTDESQVFRTARTIFDLVRTPETDRFKASAADALAMSHPRVGPRLFWGQTRIFSTLPWEAFKTLLYGAVLDEDGYGWREKDVRTKERRATLLARDGLSYGPAKGVADMMEKQPGAGSELLIEWTSDATPLKHGDQRGSRLSEATVGSFALCMLWVHRERVGVERIFRDVISTQKPDSIALVEAFADEMPSALLKFLATTPLQDQEKEFAYFRSLWKLLWRDETIRDDAAPVALRFYKYVLERLEGDPLDTALSDFVSFGFSDDFILENVLRRLVATGALGTWTLKGLFKAGRIDLPTAVTLAREARHYPDFVAELAYNFRELRSKLSLRVLIDLILDVGADAVLTARHGRMSFEEMLYGVGYTEAFESGLTTEIRRLLDSTPKAVSNLVYLAFSESKDPEEVAFRQWLALEICQSELRTSEIELILKLLLNARSLATSHPTVVAKIVETASARELLIAVISAHGNIDVGLLDEFLAISRNRNANDPEQLALLSAFEENRRKASQSKWDLFDAAYDALGP